MMNLFYHLKKEGDVLPEASSKMSRDKCEGDKRKSGQTMYFKEK